MSHHSGPKSNITNQTTQKENKIPEPETIIQYTTQYRDYQIPASQLRAFEEDLLESKRREGEIWRNIRPNK